MDDDNMDDNNIENENIKQQESQDVSRSTIPPSFKDRLNIANFNFTPAPSLASNPISPKRILRARESPTQKLGLKSPSSKRKLTSLTPTSSPIKKARSPSGYAPPSTYSHLPPLTDILPSNLICVFIGLNPGIQTAVQGHAYAHPSNRFWKLLHSSGLTSRLCLPSEDTSLPREFGLGNTNIVARPTRNGAELSKKEMDDGVSVLEEKIRKCRPECVAIVGKGIWESVWRVRKGKAIKKEEFRYGWQDGEERMGRADEEEGWEGARVFVATSTSGLAAGVPYAEKEKIWRELGEWVERRREERRREERRVRGLSEGVELGSVLKVEDGEEFPSNTTY